MKRTLYFTLIGVFILLMMVPGTSRASKSILAMEPGDPVAIVNGEKIAAINMLAVLQERHGEMGNGSEGDKKAGKINYADILNRLINVRLIIQEARNIGFDELPEFKKNVDDYKEQMLITMLLGEKTKDLKPDDEEVKKRYEGSAVEWKITSYLFKDKEDAISVVKEVREEGKPLEEAAQPYVSEEKATKGTGDTYMKKQDLLPEILELVTRMPMAEVSPVVQIEAGFVVLRLDDKRTYEETEIRQKIEDEVMAEQRKKVVEDFYKELEKKYITIDEALLDGVKYDSNESIEKAISDERVAATVQGETPITVGELTSLVKKNFFHGIESKQSVKRAEEQKYMVLEGMLRKKVFLKEALATGVEKRDDFLYAVKDYEDSLLFGTFLQRVIVPDIKIKDEELKEYYNDHVQDYTYPEMMKIYSIVFKEQGNAEKAMELLHKGTDFKWIQQNSEGVIPQDSEDILQFNGKILIVSDLPEDMIKTVTGAQAGSYKLYESPEHFFYVLYIESVTPPTPRALDEVKETIKKQVFNRKIGESVEKWAKDLRKVSDIKILIDLE